MYTLQNYNSAIYNLKPFMRLDVAPTLAVARSPTHPRQAKLQHGRSSLLQVQGYFL